MTDLDLDRLTALADAADDGPWVVYTTAQAEPVVVKAGPGRGTGYPWGVVARPSHDPVDYGFANAEFIAAAREAVPALIALLRAAAEDVVVHRSRAEAKFLDWNALVDQQQRAERERDAARAELRTLHRQYTDPDDPDTIWLCGLGQHDECEGYACLCTCHQVRRLRAALTDPAAVEAVAVALLEVDEVDCQHGTAAGIGCEHCEAAAALRAFAAFVDGEADRG